MMSKCKNCGSDVHPEITSLICPTCLRSREPSNSCKTPRCQNILSERNEAVRRLREVEARNEQLIKWMNAHEICEYCGFASMKNGVCQVGDC